MKLYHGTTQIVQKPDVSFAKQNLDFGPGFYLTSYEEQAKKWALRKALRQQAPAIINVYTLDELPSEIRLLRFDKQDIHWLKYVADCRTGKLIYQSYDVVIGGVANDDVFRTVDMYFRGIWGIQRTLKELKYYKVNDQICILSQNVLDSYLHFESSYEVENESK